MQQGAKGPFFEMQGTRQRRMLFLCEATILLKSSKINFITYLTLKR